MTHLSTTEVWLGVAGVVTAVGYTVFILAPAWGSYGRLWEKVAAGFLSLFILATLVGIGIGIGVGVLYLWFDQA